MRKLTLILIAVLCSTALAQNNTAFEVRQVALPLVSVGDQVSSGFGREDYRLVVTGSSLVRTVIELYSPEVNRLDYSTNRNTAAYFGDEMYGNNPDLKTTFTLRENTGRMLARRTFGPSEEHNIQRFFAGVLRPGQYALQIESKGNGKNAFAVRASNNVRLEASEFSVNLRGEPDQDQLVGFIDLPANAVGQNIELSNYDADGETEMQLSLLTPDGISQPLTASPDGKWVSNAIPVTNTMIGRWRVVARALGSSKQFSNAFSLRVRLNGEALYTTFPGFESPTKLKINAVAFSCGSRTELPSFPIQVNGQTIQTGETVPVTAGLVKLEGTTLAGANLRPMNIKAVQDQTTEVTLEYVVLQRIVLTPKPVVGSQELTVTISTLFPFRIPTRAELELPKEISTSAKDLFVEGAISSQQNLVWVISVQNNNPNNQTRAIARLGRECGSSQSISSVR